jgi:oligosaccharide repeat unit polymerase
MNNSRAVFSSRLAIPAIAVAIVLGVGIIFASDSVRALEILTVLGIIVIGTLVASDRWKKRNISFIVYMAEAIIFGFAPLAGWIFHVDFYFSHTVVTISNTIALVSILAMYMGEEVVLRSRKTAPAAPASVNKASRATLGSWFTEPLSPKETDRLVWLTFTLSLMGFLYLLFGQALSIQEMINTGRMELRLELLPDLSGTLARGLVIVSMVAMYLALSSGRHKLVFWTLVALNLLATGIFGERSYVLYVFAPVFFQYVAMRKKEARAGVFWVGLMGVLFVLGVLGILHVFRWQVRRNFQTFVNVVTDSRTYEFVLYEPLSDLNNRLALYNAVDLFPRQHDWLYGNTYKTILLFWLPSSMSGGLKEDTMYIFAYAVSRDPATLRERGSMHPTLPGDLYINFGYFFWVGAFLWGCLFGWIHKLISRHKNDVVHNLIGSAWVYFLLLSVRGSIYQSFLAFAACGIFLATVTWFVKVIWVPGREAQQWNLAHLRPRQPRQGSLR